MIVLSSRYDLNTDGYHGLPPAISERPFPTVTQAIAAAIRDQSRGWRRAQEISRDGVVLFPRGEDPREWATRWDRKAAA